MRANRECSDFITLGFSSTTAHRVLRCAEPIKHSFPDDKCRKVVPLHAPHIPDASREGPAENGREREESTFSEPVSPGGIGLPPPHHCRRMKWPRAIGEESTFLVPRFSFVPTSNFPLPTSHFELPTSHFPLRAIFRNVPDLWSTAAQEQL